LGKEIQQLSRSSTWTEETYLPPVTMATLPWREGISVLGFHTFEKVLKKAPILRKGKRYDALMRLEKIFIF
jgi:hypothetical protein